MADPDRVQRRERLRPAEGRPVASGSTLSSTKTSISKTRHLLSNLAVLSHASAFWCNCNARRADLGGTISA